MCENDVKLHVWAFKGINSDLFECLCFTLHRSIECALHTLYHDPPTACFIFSISCNGLTNSVFFLQPCYSIIFCCYTCITVQERGYQRKTKMRFYQRGWHHLVMKMYFCHLKKYFTGDAWLALKGVVAALKTINLCLAHYCGRCTKLIRDETDNSDLVSLQICQCQEAA